MFRIYYADGSTFDGDAFDAPFFGVLLVLESEKEHGRRIISNGDYYVWEDRWRAVDFIGMVDYLQRPGAKRVISGRMVDNDLWNAIYAIADSDPDFPIRTAYQFHEKRER